jgi:hypothetical protein
MRQHGRDDQVSRTRGLTQPDMPSWLTPIRASLYEIKNIIIIHFM